MWSQASSLILGAWTALGLSFVGLGLLLCWGARTKIADAEGWLLAFWIGWVATLFALQVWQLVLPVDARALALVVVVGLLGLIAAVVSGARPRLHPTRQWPLLVALTAAVLWLSNRALSGPQHGDAGAYFIPTVRWLADYPIVRGLGNLFVPLAFNQSYFLYVAMLDVGPFAHRSYHLANGLLVLALLARSLLGFHRLVRSGRCAPVDVFYALLLPAIVALGQGIFLTSPSPDVGIFVLGVVVSGQLIALLSRSPSEPTPVRDVLAIALVAVGGITVKLSFAGLGAATVAFAGLVYLVRTRPGWAGAAGTILAASAVVAAGFVPWVVRNILLSGCPFYPSPVGALPVDWRVKTDALEWVLAPMHFGVPPWYAFRDPHWYYTRLDSLGWIAPDVLVPTGIALVAMLLGLVLWLVRLVRRRPPATPRLPVLLLLPTIVSFTFVAESAPMPRYMGATFWLVAVESILLLMGRAAFGEGSKCRRLAGTIVLIATVALLAQKRPFFHEGTDFDTAPVPPVTETHLASGLVVGVPQYGQCWNTPLPCTPAPNPGLRLRRPDDLGSGFVVDDAGSG